MEQDATNKFYLVGMSIFAIGATILDTCGAWYAFFTSLNYPLLM